MSVPVERRYALGRTRPESIVFEPAPRFGNLAKAAAVGTAALLAAGSGALWLRHTAHPKDYAVNLKLETRFTKAPATSALGTAAITATTKAAARPAPKPPGRSPAPSAPAAPRPSVAPSPATTLSTLKPGPAALHSAALGPSTYYVMDASWPASNCMAPATVFSKANAVIADVDHGLPNNFNSDPSNEADPKTHKPISCFDKEIKYARRLELYVNSAAPLRQNEFDYARQSPNPIACGQNLDQCGLAYGYKTGLAEAGFASQHDLKNWNRRVWLDVENCGSYQCWNTSDLNENVQTIKGQIRGLEDGFKKLGPVSVGFYSTSLQWNEITGGDFQDDNPARPIWIASGSGDFANAAVAWRSRVFDNGVPVYSQYVGSAPIPDGATQPLDYDVLLNGAG